MVEVEAAIELQKMILEKTGVIVEGKDPVFLHSRLHSIMQFHQLKTLTDLLDCLKKNSTLFDEVVDVVTTHESLFFRDAIFFEALNNKVFPYFHQKRASQKRLRIWSAACSYGQEPYSIAMMLLSHPLDFSGWHIQICATDISKKAVQRGKEGVFSHFEVQRGLTIKHLTQYFNKHPQGWRITDKIIKMVSFDCLNLMNSSEHLGIFDVVLLRNVLIYFSKETKEKVLNNMRKGMSADSFLGLGGPETLLGLKTPFEPWADNSTGASIYQPIQPQQGKDKK